MGWISMAVAAACGALAALLAGALLRGRSQSMAHYAAVWAAFAVVFFVPSQQLITPALQSRYDVSRLDDSLSRNASFAAIKKHDPQTYIRITSELSQGLLQGKSHAELIDRVRSEVTTLVQKRLPKASDEAATDYMRVMVQEMGELRRHGGDLCYRFLFAKSAQSLDLRKYVSANTIEADDAALSQVVRSSTLTPQAVPAQAEVADGLRPVFEVLAARYGQDLALLQNPLAPGADPDKLCSMSIDMYTVILQRPVAESGRLIRYLMGQT